MIAKIIPTTEDEWKKCRKEGIGSSEIGTIFGRNKYETRLDWWNKKTGRVQEGETTEAMHRGHELEDAVAQGFCRKTGSQVIKASAGNIIYYDKNKPWRRVTPDRFCWIPDKKQDRNSMACRFILECKTHVGYIDTDSSLFDLWELQLMYQMGVCGCPYGYLAWLDSSLNVDFREYAFDQEKFDDICAVIDSVWQTNVVNDIAPDPITYKDVVCIYSKHESGKSVQLSEGIVSKVSKAKELSDNIKKLELELSKVKDEIAVEMKDAESATDEDGNVLCTFKANKAFNEEELKQSDPRLYYQFCEHQSDKFNKDAFKRSQGTKVYNSYCTSSGARVMRFS